jgi:hypothetical protein
VLSKLARRDCRVHTIGKNYDRFPPERFYEIERSNVIYRVIQTRSAAKLRFVDSGKDRRLLDCRVRQDPHAAVERNNHHLIGRSKLIYECDRSVMDLVDLVTRRRAGVDHQQYGERHLG